MKGSIVAIVTPMLKNGDIDFASFKNLLSFHADAGTDGIVLVGTTGESATLNKKERAEIFSFANSNTNIPLMAGVGSSSTAEAIELVECSLKNGIKKCLAVTPYYNKPSQKGLELHYTELSQVGAEIILYNVPGRTGVDLLPTTIEKLIEIKTISGIKEAVNTEERFLALSKIKDKRQDFQLYSGDDPSIGDGKVTGEGGNAFKLECKHGRIVLIAKSSDIELRGRNISLVATKNIHLNAKINTTIDTGNDMNIWAKNDMNLDSNKELFINGGNAVGIHCEADVIHTTSGRDEEDAPDFYKDFSGFYDPTVPQATRDSRDDEVFQKRQQLKKEALRQEEEKREELIERFRNKREKFRKKFLVYIYYNLYNNFYC